MQKIPTCSSGDTKILSFALGDAKVPNASSFASQWNIRFRFDRATLDYFKIDSNIKKISGRGHCQRHWTNEGYYIQQVSHLKNISRCDLVRIASLYKGQPHLCNIYIRMAFFYK